MKVQVEIMRTRTLTIDEHCVVELNVPKNVLREYEDGDDSAITNWIEENEQKLDTLLRQEMEMSDESESIEYDSAEVIEA